MRHIIVATHGKFAEGILDSVRLIMGEHKEAVSYTHLTLPTILLV